MDDAVIVVGSTFEGYFSETPDEKSRFQITDGEPDQNKGLIAKTSPIAKAALGFGEGDEIEIRLGDRLRLFTVTGVIDGESAALNPAAGPDEAQAAQKPLLEREDLVKPGYKPTLERLIAYLIQENGPLRRDHLIRLVREEHGFKKAGHRIRDAVNAAIGKHRNERADPDGESVFWPVGQTPQSHIPYRGQSARSWDEVPHAEKRELARTILQDPETEDPYAALVKKTGFSRVFESRKLEFEALLANEKKG